MADTKSDVSRAEPTANTGGGDPLGAILASPILWGVVVTFAFYAGLPHLPVQRELMVRYFCSHPLEYATTGLFFVGLAVLVTKALRSVFEASVFRRPEFAYANVPTDTDAVTTSGVVSQRIASLSPDTRRSWLGTRVDDVCSYVRSRRSTAGLEEHLKYLAEVAAERLHGSYALIRTITWAVPILGFLGTVIGITIAIANVTPEQLDTSLGEVTGGLAVAFDTTALALALSLVLVFASFLVERSEQNVLARVEDHGVRRLMALFPENGAKGSTSPLAEAERRAAEQLLEGTETLVDRQVRAWDESLEAMRSRWNETLDGQQSQLAAALESGIAGTLDEHDRRLREMREEFVAAFERAGATLVDGLAEGRAAQTALQAEFGARIEELWTRVSNGLGELHDRNTSRVDGLAEAIAQRLGGWLTRLEAANSAAAGQREELQKQGETLLKIVEQEGQLVRLQGQLNENLDAVRAAETFDETLHQLTAAVHLLTARAKPKAA